MTTHKAVRDWDFYGFRPLCVRKDKHISKFWKEVTCKQCLEQRPSKEK